MVLYNSFVIITILPLLFIAIQVPSEPGDTPRRCGGYPSFTAADIENSHNIPKLFQAEGRTPEFDSKTGSNRDMSTWVPFKALFLINPAVEDRDRVVIESVADEVNSRLGKMIRGPRQNDVRFPTFYCAAICCSGRLYRGNWILIFYDCCIVSKRLKV